MKMSKQWFGLTPCVLGMLIFVANLNFSRMGWAKHEATDHQGLFVQAAMMGAIDLDIDTGPRLFDIGPGAFLGIGYNFGVLGLRTHFRYAQMDSALALDSFFGTNSQSDLYGGSLEVKVMPLGNQDTLFQPYLVGGVGASYLETERFVYGVMNTNGDWGFAGNVGAGIDIFLLDHLAITFETNIRPSVFISDSERSDDFGIDDIYFFDFMGGITYTFGRAAAK